MLPNVRREDWYQTATNTNWDISYVDEEEMYPPGLTGQDAYNVPEDGWESWEETYKQTAREYYETQHEKDGSVYAVSSAMDQSGLPHSLGMGWEDVLKFHFATVPLLERAAVTSESQYARFAPDSAWRHMAQFGAMDELRHTELQLRIPHSFVKEDSQYDWAKKMYHTEDWASVAARHLFDDFKASNAIDSALQITFAFETGFTNMQFLALASDAADVGDIEFSEAISSIQTDEARHAQQGNAIIEILDEYDDLDRAQYLVDKSFWRCYKLFSALTGPSMDYYTPVEDREMSWGEFMEEWIVDQFLENIESTGLEKPWYWDQFIELVRQGGTSHYMAGGHYHWRPTLPIAPPGVTAEDREWLEEKYPGWEERWGEKWDRHAKAMREDDLEKTVADDLIVLCDLCQLPAIHADPDQDHNRLHCHEHDGETYYFCSEPCQWIFENEPERYAEHKSILRRFLAGDIQPQTLEGALEHMGMGADNDYERGIDFRAPEWGDDWADWSPSSSDPAGAASDD
ncbi:YHS domain-containing protein [Halobellus litoreus]|uniref:YHS domain-containing protein n=1 Tax=Halobellus litoreus TaxID=755310 RepID=A0ABD6DTB2_9EURY|nr:YHS domain-containing protein [Halobellus litoreus]